MPIVGPCILIHSSNPSAQFIKYNNNQITLIAFPYASISASVLLSILGIFLVRSDRHLICINTADIAAATYVTYARHVAEHAMPNV